jgi:hypothetical protein
MQTEKQRERLVELLKEADANPYNREITNFEDIMEMIADYLMSNNVVVLPCKIGDNVFFLHYGEICEATVVNVEYNYYTNPQEWVTVEYRSEAIGTNRYKTRIDLMFGKTVFLSRAEAENVLKERNNGT